MPPSPSSPHAAMLASPSIQAMRFLMGSSTQETDLAAEFRATIRGHGSPIERRAPGLAAAGSRNVRRTMGAAVRFEHDGAIGTITLDRPDNRNSMTAELLDAFSAALAEARATSSLRCLIITGTGACFSAGAD